MKKIIKSELVATPNAPISMAVVAGETVFVSGIVSLNASGDVVGDGDVKAQTHQILHNISFLLGEVGGDLSNIVKTTVYITDFENYGAMNEVYAEYFKVDPPARATVKAGLFNSDLLVEIDAIAVI